MASSGYGACRASGPRPRRQLPRVLVPVNHSKRRNHLGELFKTVTAMLLARDGQWRTQECTVWPFHLCLGESIGRGIPYRALALNPAAASSPPLVNFYRFFKSLTWKVEMVQTLRRYCAAQGIDAGTLMPDSFTFRAKRNPKRERQRFIDSYMAAGRQRGVANVWIVKPSGGGKGKDIELVGGESVCQYACLFLELTLVSPPDGRLVRHGVPH